MGRGGAGTQVFEKTRYTRLGSTGEGELRSSWLGEEAACAGTRRLGHGKGPLQCRAPTAQGSHSRGTEKVMVTEVKEVGGGQEGRGGRQDSGRPD